MLRTSNTLMIVTTTLLLTLTACSGGIRPVAYDGAGRELPLRNELISYIEPVAQPELYETPWDATPDPDGATIYFTANTRDGAGVFQAPAAGGETSVLATGEPLVAPLGLAVSTDGGQLFIADATAASDHGAGQVFVLATGGGAPNTLAGTEGTAPRGVEVHNENGVDMLYFSGNDPSNGEPTIWKIGASGGQAEVVFQGAPLVEPVGLAITQNGTVYVADRAATGNGLGSVFRIADGAVESIADSFRTGTPVVGATLTTDESVLLVSALAPDQESAQVLVIVLNTLEKGIVTRVIGGNTGSGGVHRAPNRNLFAWADSTVNKGQRPGGRGTGGAVYALAPNKQEAGAEGVR